MYAVILLNYFTSEIYFYVLLLGLLIFIKSFYNKKIKPLTLEFISFFFFGDKILSFYLLLDVSKNI